MQIKKLEFRDVTTDLGKEKGLVFLEYNGLLCRYLISNQKLGDELPSNNFYVSFNCEEITFNDLESAKQFCQKHFENKIIDLFFEKKSFFSFEDFWFQSLKKDFIDLFKKSFKEHFRLW